MNRSKPPVLYREMIFDRAAIDESSRVVELSFSSEAPIIRRSWFMEDWTEILRHEPQAINLGRIRDMGVLLYMHSSYNPIGSIIDPILDEIQRKCKAKARFDTDAQSDAVFQKVLSGTLRGVSVGYRVLDDDWEVVKDGKMSSCGRFAGPCEIANRWTPYEVSIVSLPADATVGVGRSMGTGFEMAEFMSSRMADAIAERIIKNIPFTIPPVDKPPEQEEQRTETSSRIAVMRRKLELTNRLITL